MAIAQWEPAKDGSGWDRIRSAWLVLHALVTAAAAEDRRERS